MPNNFVDFAFAGSRDALTTANEWNRFAKTAIRVGDFADALEFATGARSYVWLSVSLILDHDTDPRFVEHFDSGEEIRGRASEIAADARSAIDDPARRANARRGAAEGAGVKVASLTHSNRITLDKWRAELPSLVELKKTTVVFSGSAADVLAELRKLKDTIHVREGGRSFDNRAIVAVVNKVDHFVNGGKYAKHVSVIA